MGQRGSWSQETAKLSTGVNPCAEILLDSKGLCNLTTVNVMAFVKDGVLDHAGLMEAQRLSARAGYRMTCTELEIPEWNAVQQRDKLLGCSLTGWQGYGEWPEPEPGGTAKAS